MKARVLRGVKGKQTKRSICRMIRQGAEVPGTAGTRGLGGGETKESRPGEIRGSAENEAVRGNLSSFLRQKKELKEKEGISSTIEPRGIREKGPSFCVVSVRLLRRSTPPLARTGTFSACSSIPFRCFYL